MDDNLAEELEDILDKRDPGMTGQPLYDRLAEPRLLLGRHRRQVSLFMDFGSGRRRTEFKTKCCGAEAVKRRDGSVYSTFKIPFPLFLSTIPY